MIYPGLALLAVSLYSVFISDDLIEFSRALLRCALSILFLLAVSFEDPGVLESSVLFFCILILSFFALIRNEVQVHHDQS